MLQNLFLVHIDLSQAHAPIMPTSPKDDPDRHTRTVRWSKEVDVLADQMANDDGFTYNGRTHVNEWLEKIVRKEKLQRKLAAGESLSDDEQTMLDAEDFADQARKLYYNLSKKPRKKK